MWTIIGARSILNVGLLILVCRFDLSIGRAAEQPTRFTLSTSDVTTGNVATELTSRFDHVRELLGRVGDSIRIGTGRFVNSVTLARNIIVDRTENLASESQDNVAITYQKTLQTTQQPPVINTRPYSRETVRLENETAQSFFERPVVKPKTGILESFLSPTPLVDGIKEQEKYGNSGDKFIGIGRALVNSFEGFSNFLNTIVDLPRNAVQKTSRGITDALNQVGARLVGLQ